MEAIVYIRNEVCLSKENLRWLAILDSLQSRQRIFFKVLVYPREKVVTKDLQKEVRQPVFIVKDGKVQSRDLSSNCQARNNVNLSKSRRISRVSKRGEGQSRRKR